MKEKNTDLLWPLLKDLAASLEVEVRIDNLGEMSGGLCKLNGKSVMLLDKKLNTAGRNFYLGKALQSLDWEDKYLLPAVRDFLQRI